MGSLTSHIACLWITSVCDMTDNILSVVQNVLKSSKWYIIHCKGHIHVMYVFPKDICWI